MAATTHGGHPSAHVRDVETRRAELGSLPDVLHNPDVYLHNPDPANDVTCDYMM